VAPAFLSVAVDVTGPERPAGFARGFDFPTVVDSQNVLGRLLDFDVVPNGVLLDAAGQIAFVHLGGFDVRRDEVRARIEGLLDELAARTPRGSAPALPQRGLAAETLLAEVAARPDEADLWNELGETHAAAGDDAAALAAYDRALELDGRLGGAHFGRGSLLARGGRGDEAIAAWKRALALDPANFVVRKQIWAHRHPEKFWPEIDAEWQREEMAREQAGRSDLPARPA
jgi:tetratricopeptide (TPR) repeat protein